MDKGDIQFGSLIVGGITLCALSTLGLVYAIVTVAKWAWGS